jgi:hypothetical protein
VVSGTVIVINGGVDTEKKKKCTATYQKDIIKMHVRRSLPVIFFVFGVVPVGPFVHGIVTWYCNSKYLLLEQKKRNYKNIPRASSKEKKGKKKPTLLLQTWRLIQLTTKKPWLCGLALAFQILSQAKAIMKPSSRPGLAWPIWAWLGPALGLRPGQAHPYF